MQITLVIMAAGMGSRYGGLKQIDPMGPNGEFLMEYSVYDAIRAGFSKVVFIIRREFEQEFRDKIGNKFAEKIKVEYAFQELIDIPEGFSLPEGRTKPWGTGQAILAARKMVDTPFAVLNADDFYGSEAYTVMAQHLKKVDPNSTDSCMVGFEIRNTLSSNGAVTRGICEAKDEHLISVVERAKIEINAEGQVQYFEDGLAYDLTGSEISSMNFWGFTPRLFDLLEQKFNDFLQAHGTEMKSEWLIPTIVDELIQEGQTRTKVLSSRDKWFGVTYPEDKPMVTTAIRELVDNGKYPTPLFQ